MEASRLIYTTKLLICRNGDGSYNAQMVIIYGDGATSDPVWKAEVVDYVQIDGD